jgi:hypothetical protein
MSLFATKGELARETAANNKLNKELKDTVH